MSIVISSIESVPFATWKAMWLDYLGEYAVGLPDEQHQTTYTRLADPQFNLSGLIGESGHPVGFAHYYFHASTFHLSEACCLQDLYVSPSARGRGIGRELVEAVAGRARSRGASVLHWKTRDSNLAAQALYSRFAQRSDFVSFSLRL